MDTSYGNGFNGDTFDANQAVDTVADSGFGNGAASTDYLAPPSSWTIVPGPAAFTTAAHPFLGSSSTNVVHVLSNMDLNAGNGWPDMGAYAAYIHSGQEVHAIPPLPLFESHRGQ